MNDFHKESSQVVLLRGVRSNRFQWTTWIFIRDKKFGAKKAWGHKIRTIWGPPVKVKKNQLGFSSKTELPSSAQLG